MNLFTKRNRFIDLNNELMIKTAGGYRVGRRHRLRV